MINVEFEYIAVSTSEFISKSKLSSISTSGAGISTLISSSKAHKNTGSFVLTNSINLLLFELICVEARFSLSSSSSSNHSSSDSQYSSESSSSKGNET